jgi:sucrose-6-phosphate hydrolase SacC (GH32 family)
VWHLYHQANPNGAFWEHIVWGHLVSEDLATWEARLPALIPCTGFDRRGVWVGNRIPDTEPPAILYTGVDGTRSGLGRAVM